MEISSMNTFIQSQIASWPLARDNYGALATIRRREFSFGSYRVVVQFNPARRVSTGASLTAQAIASRPCFLCQANRPAQQQALPFVSSDGLHFSILVNPFPIFDRHLTIVSDMHEPQHLLDRRYLRAMVELSWLMPDMAVFFNGAHCGASAPDHMHFQASPAADWPLFADFESSSPQLIRKDDGVELYYSASLGRMVYKIVSDDADILFDQLSSILASHDRGDDMVNVIAWGSSIYVIPRKAFRPWQYDADEQHQLMISPASVEVGGIFITPVEEHFDKITSQDVESIFGQVCFTPPAPGTM